MNELTIEQKAELYDKAIERGNSLLSCNELGNAWVYKILPELESEDEQIRKWIIDDIRFNISLETLNNSEYKKKAEKAIDWLEQQSEQSSNILWHDVSEEPEEQRELFCKWKGSNIDAVWHDVAFYHADTKTFWDGEHQIEDVIKWAYIDEMLNKSNPYSGVSFQYNSHIWGMCARDNGVEISIDNELKAFVSIDKSFIYPIHPQPYLAPKSASQAIKEIIVDNANNIINKNS